MIFGDPFRFAFVVDVVDEWCANEFKGGVLFLSVDGVFFPRQVYNTTLSCDLYHLFNDPTSVLLNKPINNKLFNMDKFAAFQALCEITFPPLTDDVNDNDFTYYCDFTELGTDKCHVFAVSNGDSVRILAGENFPDVPNYSNNKIQEAFLTIEELDHYLLSLKGYYESRVI